MGLFEYITSPVLPSSKRFVENERAIQQGEADLYKNRARMQEQEMQQQEMAPLFNILKDKNMSPEVKQAAARELMNKPAFQNLKAQLGTNTNMIRQPNQDIKDIFGMLGVGQPPQSGPIPPQQGGVFGNIVPQAQPTQQGIGSQLELTNFGINAEGLPSYQFGPVQSEQQEYYDPETGFTKSRSVRKGKPRQEIVTKPAEIEYKTMVGLDGAEHLYEIEKFSGKKKDLGTTKRIGIRGEFQDPKDGQTYLLKDDGTWYNASGQPIPSPPPGIVNLGTAKTEIKMEGDKIPEIERDIEAALSKSRELSAKDTEYDFVPDFVSSLGGYAQKPVPKKVPEMTERKEKVKSELQQRKLAMIEQYIDFNKIGLAQGNWTKLKTWAGQGTLDESRLKIFMASNLKSMYDTAGKQVSEKEIEKVLAFMPTNLGISDNDFQAQWEIFLWEVKTTGQLTDEEWEKAGFRQIDFSGGIQQGQEIQKMKNTPVIKTDEDYDKLPSGVDFYDPQGKLRRKP